MFNQAGTLEGVGRCIVNPQCGAGGVQLQGDPHAPVKFGIWERPGQVEDRDGVIWVDPAHKNGCGLQ